MPSLLTSLSDSLTTNLQRIREKHEKTVKARKHILVASRKAQKEFSSMYDSLDEGLSERMKKVEKIKAIEVPDWCDELLKTLTKYELVVRKTRKGNKLNGKVQDGVAVTKVSLTTRKMLKWLEGIASQVNKLKNAPDDKKIKQVVVILGRNWSKNKNEEMKWMGLAVREEEKELKDQVDTQAKDIKKLAACLSPDFIGKVRAFDEASDPSERIAKSEKLVSLAASVQKKVVEVRDVSIKTSYADLADESADLIKQLTDELRKEASNKPPKIKK